jgi:hypothetical protein
MVVAMRSLTRQDAYDLPARRIGGSHAEKLEQIDAAIQELLDIKVLECAGDRPNVRFIATPRRTHGTAMFITIVVLLIVLVWLLGTRSPFA